MIVGVDIDGTITKHPELFRILCKALREEGHAVHIVTCRMEPEHTEKTLEEMDIEYDRLHLLPAEESYTSASEWKREVCQKEKIGVLFENDPEILMRVPEGTEGIFIL